VLIRPITSMDQTSAEADEKGAKPKSRAQLSTS